MNENDAEIDAQRAAILLSDWVDSLWTLTCPHGGGYARDCTRCIHETLHRSAWLAAHDRAVMAGVIPPASSAAADGDNQ